MSILDKVLGRNSSHVSHKLKGPARLKGESWDSYKKRQKREKRLLKNYLRGDLVWCAKAFKQTQLGVDEHGNPITIMTVDRQTSKGTYIEDKHGHIESPRRAT